MRPILLALFVTVLAAAPAAAAKRPFCDSRGGATLVSDGAHRIYETIVPDPHDGDADVTSVFTCLNGSRTQSHRLERFDNTLDGAARPVSARLAGRWMLMDISEETGVTAGHALRVYDLRKHKRLGGIYEEGADDFKELVLTADGAFAATLIDGELGAFDSAGAHDLSPAAVAAAAGGAFVYWRNADGTTGSSRLAGPPTKFTEIS